MQAGRQAREKKSEISADLWFSYSSVYQMRCVSVICLMPEMSLSSVGQRPEETGKMLFLLPPGSRHLGFQEPLFSVTTGLFSSQLAQ